MVKYEIKTCSDEEHSIIVINLRVAVELDTFTKLVYRLYLIELPLDLLGERCHIVSGHIRSM